jgi:hypothetical protein
MVPSMATVGVRFDIEKVNAGFYGSVCWQIFWRAILPEDLGPALLYEGDTSATLDGRENVFCIAVQSMDSGVTAKVKGALQRSEDFRKVCAEPMFAENQACVGEPLPDAGRIDATGNLVGQAGTSRSALGTVRREKGAAAQTAAPAGPAAQRTKPASPRTAELPQVSTFKELGALMQRIFSTPEATFTYYLTPEELCDVVERYADLIETQFSESSCGLSEDMAYIRLFQKDPPEGNPIEFVGMFPYASPSDAAVGWKDMSSDPKFAKAFPRLADIQGKWHLNFHEHFGNPRDITYKKKNDVPPAELWARICTRRQRLQPPSSAKAPAAAKPNPAPPAAPARPETHAAPPARPPAVPAVPAAPASPAIPPPAAQHQKKWWQIWR